MATVNKPILLDETGKAIVSALQAQTEALKKVNVIGNPADYIVDCEYIEGEVTAEYFNEETSEIVTETVPTVTSWYEIYASGKVRQGGVIYGFVDQDAGHMVDRIIFSIPMEGKVYAVTLSDICNNLNSIWSFTPGYLESTGFTLMLNISIAMTENATVAWQVEGMGANL